MCTRNQALEILQRAYVMCNEALEKRVQEAYLYGSYARGDFHSESDVDILITANVDAQELAEYSCYHLISEVCSELSLEYDVTVSITVKPLDQFQRFRYALPYYSNVVNEGIRYTK